MEISPAAAAAAAAAVERAFITRTDRTAAAKESLLDAGRWLVSGALAELSDRSDENTLKDRGASGS